MHSHSFTRPLRRSRAAYIGPRLATANAIAAAVLVLGGCTLAPTYQRPVLPVSTDWPVDTVPGAFDAASASSSPASGMTPTTASTAAMSPTTVAANDLGWRDFFVDPVLQRLIDLSLANNRDARIAAVNVAAARAQYRIQRADLFPTISATTEESVTHTPTGVLTNSVGGGTGAVVAPGTGADPGTGSGVGVGVGTGDTTGTVGSGGVTRRSFSVGVGFTAYEIDLFGRIRSLSEQRLEQYFGYVETMRSTVISLIAEVANAYLTVLSDQELLRVTQVTLKSQQDSYEIVRRAFEGGVQSGLALRQAETSVDTARANIWLYTRQLAQDRHALALLLGTPVPSDLPPTESLDKVQLIQDLPAGVPSQVLTRRPDVLSAEHNLAAASASIGAARAAFFPAISLTGNFGTASNQLSGLFESGSRSWSFLPQISLPLFAGGANVANLELTKTQRDLYVAQYEKTVQIAFREVSDALVARGTLDQQLQAQKSLQEATDDAYNLSELRFQNGIDNYLNVLDSQRAQYSAQQSYITVKLSRLQNLVTLYKVLGGGWNETTVPVGATPRGMPVPPGGQPDNANVSSTAPAKPVS